MHPLWFSGLTLLGATLWCTVLAAIGYYIGPSVLVIVHHYSNEANVLFAVFIVLGSVWFLRKK